MTPNRIINIAVLALLLGATVPVFAQKGQNDKKGNGGKGQQTQHQQQARHAKLAQHQQQPQRAQQVQRRQQPRHIPQNNGNNGFHGQGNNGNHYGRIPDASFHAKFGRNHAFRVGRPSFLNGYYRFQYGGYWFGYRDQWPAGWDYNDDVYVDYVGGAYYMYSPRHPGIHITLNLF